MKNIEKYAAIICRMIAESHECYFGMDCDECELRGICCNAEKLLHYMLKNAYLSEDEERILREPQGTE